MLENSVCDSSRGLAFFLVLLLFSALIHAQGLTPVDQNAWTEGAVRKVLHTFAYGGQVSDAQIKKWAGMTPQKAIEEMLTFQAVNLKLSPGGDITSAYGGSLESLQTLWESNDPDNQLCPDVRSDFSVTQIRPDGETVLYRRGLQQTWISAVRARGLNPFRHLMGFYLTNYHMAVNLKDTQTVLVRELYDRVMEELEAGQPFYRVLASGASSAAVAMEYGHRNNRYNNFSGRFTGNDDFAREFHQLFFRINGDLEDPNYHENTTIEHTAWVLTGMQLDRDPTAYGVTVPFQWWVAPIVFLNHTDPSGRRVLNLRWHHSGSLEILHQTISGRTAEEKLNNLAQVAAMHPESLVNLPVTLINFFADDNLTDAKKQAIQQAWQAVAGQPNDLLKFLQAYAVSTTFHSPDTYKFRTAFHRNMTLYNLNTVDMKEFYGNTLSPIWTMRRQGAEVFVPVHDVFGGQTSLNAANNPQLFKEAYNTAVDKPYLVIKTAHTCRDGSGRTVSVWQKDWSRIIPANPDGTYSVDKVGEWLWNRFVGDSLEHYGVIERAYVNAFLAQGVDLGYALDPNNPEGIYSPQVLAVEPLASRLAAMAATRLQLNSSNSNIRRQANQRVGMAINFISMTPYMFAVEPSPGIDDTVAGIPVDPTPTDPTPTDPGNGSTGPTDPGSGSGSNTQTPTATTKTTEFKGLIELLTTDYLVINGLQVWITPDTLVKFEGHSGGEFLVGHNTEGKGVWNVDGSMTALKITVK